MAERRMFAKTIALSDAFLDMPMSARCLYFTLGMVADDDGFVNRPKAVMRECGASQDDMSLLLHKKFLIAFESGVVVIKHWRLNNYLRNDRYKETAYQEEKQMLNIEPNGAYSMVGIPSGNQMDTNGIPSIDKDRLGKVSLEENKCTRHKYGEYHNVLLTDEELEKLKAEYFDYEMKIEQLSSYMASTGKSYKNHLATIRNWARRDAEKDAERKAKEGKLVSTPTYDLNSYEAYANDNTEI